MVIPDEEGGLEILPTGFISHQARSNSHEKRRREPALLTSNKDNINRTCQNTSTTAKMMAGRRAPTQRGIGREKSLDLDDVFGNQYLEEKNFSKEDVASRSVSGATSHDHAEESGAETDTGNSVATSDTRSRRKTGKKGRSGHGSRRKLKAVSSHKSTSVLGTSGMLLSYNDHSDGSDKEDEKLAPGQIEPRQSEVRSKNIPSRGAMSMSAIQYNGGNGSNEHKEISRNADVDGKHSSSPDGKSKPERSGKSRRERGERSMRDLGEKSSKSKHRDHHRSSRDISEWPSRKPHRSEGEHTDGKTRRPDRSDNHRNKSNRDLHHRSGRSGEKSRQRSPSKSRHRSPSKPRHRSPSKSRRRSPSRSRGKSKSRKSHQHGEPSSPRKTSTSSPLPKSPRRARQKVKPEPDQTNVDLGSTCDDDIQVFRQQVTEAVSGVIAPDDINQSTKPGSPREDNTTPLERPSISLKLPSMRQLSLDEQSPKSLLDEIESHDSKQLTNTDESDTDDDSEADTVLQFDPTQNDNLYRVKQVASENSSLTITNADGTQVDGHISQVFDPVGDAQEILGSSGHHEEEPIFDFLEDNDLETDKDNGAADAGALDERLTELPSAKPVVLDAPSLGAPSLDGPSLDGPSLDGPSLDGPSLDGPSLAGPSLADEEGPTQSEGHQVRDSGDGFKEEEHMWPGHEQGDDEAPMIDFLPGEDVTETDFVEDEDFDDPYFGSNIPQFNPSSDPFGTKDPFADSGNIGAWPVDQDELDDAVDAELGFFGEDAASPVSSPVPNKPKKRVAKKPPSGRTKNGTGASNTARPRRPKGKKGKVRKPPKKESEYEEESTNYDTDFSLDNVIETPTKGARATVGTSLEPDLVHGANLSPSKIVNKLMFALNASFNGNDEDEDDDDDASDEDDDQNTSAVKAMARGGSAPDDSSLQMSATSKGGKRKIPLALGGSIGRYFGRGRKNQVDDDDVSLSSQSTRSRLFGGGKKKNHQLLGDDSSCDSGAPF